MYKVTTLEMWKNHITATGHEFDSISQLNRFVYVCKEDGIIVLVHNSKQTA